MRGQTLRQQLANDSLWIMSLASLGLVLCIAAGVTWWTTESALSHTSDCSASTAPPAAQDDHQHSAHHDQHQHHDQQQHQQPPLHGAHAPEAHTASGHRSHPDFFTNNGQYMPRTHCLMTATGEPDWPWIITLLVLSGTVIIAYLRIYGFWCRSYLAEQPRDRNPRLMDLAQVFLWCAVCGYAAQILMFFWPAYRLVAVCLLMLNIWTWRFVLRLGDFRSTFSAGRFRRLAERDALTDLPNRMAVINTINSRLRTQSTTNEQTSTLTVLFLDMDKFKLVNDSMGHDAGDMFLQQIAARLRETCREMEKSTPELSVCTPGRLGGDEFVIVIEAESAPDAPGIAQPLCDAVCAALAEPYEIEGRVIHTSATIGLTSTDLPYDNAAEMLRDADTAMYVAKRQRRGTAVQFDPQMHMAVRERVEIEADLRLAISEQTLTPHYQPIIDLETGEIRAFEALLRWEHPQRGMVPPATFIPVAEESGLISEIGLWTLAQGANQVARWRRAYPEIAGAVFNVNVSPVQFASETFVEDLLDGVAGSGLEPGAICLEITETAVVRDRERSIALLDQLRDAGFRIAMDDFGTGYSSLSCLHEFPLTDLKIDRSFVANLSGRRDYSAVVNAIATLARNLGFRVTAEGIETMEQVAQLQALDCQSGQGYLFLRPAPADEIEAFLDDRRRQRRSA